MKHTLPRIFLVCLFAAASTVASETNKTAATPVKDYGRGFAKFYKLGLPDAKGGQYVNLSLRGGRQQQSMMQRAYMGGVQLKGNGWLIAPDSTNSPHRYISSTGEFDVYDYKVVAKEQRERQMAALKKAKESGKPSTVSFNSMDNEKTSATWREVDPTADANKLIAYLDKQGAQDSFKYQLAQLAGPLFFQAAHLYRNGYTNEANQIVSHLFSLSEDRREIIIGALNTIADSQLNKTTQTFFENQDWAAYQEDLLSLMRRFRSGWKQAPAVKRLYTVVQAHSLTAEPPAIVGDDLAAEDHALARDLCSMTVKDAVQQFSAYNRSGWHDRTLWILTPPNDPEDATSESAGEPKPVQSNIIERIRMRGFASVPLLLAMLDDDYLLNISKQELRGGGSFSSSYYSNNGDMTEARITQMYNQMRRPVTRGEIAHALLQQLLPKDDDLRRSASGEDDIEDLKADCLQWYQDNKDKSVLELARVYLTEGGRQQRRSAVQFLSKFGADADFVLVEKTFLEGEQNEYSYIITQYVQTRGEKSKAFVSQYTNTLMEAAGEDDNAVASAKRTIKQLEQIVSAGSVDDILESIISGKKKFSEMQAILRTRIWQPANGVEIMATLLGAASKMPEAQDSNSLLSMVLQFRYYQNSGSGSAMKLPALETYAELWKTLLADKRPVLDYRLQGAEATIGDMTARNIEFLYAEDKGVAMNQTFALGMRVLPLIHKRASQRLAGTAPSELPELPSANNVPEEALEVIIADIQKSEDMPATLSALSMDALLALREPFTTQSNLWKKTASVAQRIQQVEIDEPLRGMMSHLDDWKGKLANSDMLNTLISDGLKIAESGEPAELKLVRGAAFAGITITATRIDTNQTRYANWSSSLRNNDKEGRARVNANINVQRGYKSAIWFSESTDSEPKTSVASEKDSDLLDAFEDELVDDTKRSKETNQKLFREAIELFCAPGCDVYPSATLHIIAIPPTNK